jgi:DNA polymerase-1
LAHFSQDAALKEAFLNGEDIHMATAIKLFGNEAKDKRNIAKSINFGLLYGMGPKKLSLEIGVTQNEAKEIIKSYFETFPTVKSYLESIQEDAKDKGYVKTLLGRKRMFDYEGANGMQKAAILRESVNTVFQGSAADLIKLSMLQISKTIEQNSFDCNMLLQIHDELIFEIQEDVATKLSQEFADIMSSIYELEVPLECSVAIGDSWGELK